MADMGATRGLGLVLVYDSTCAGAADALTAWEFISYRLHGFAQRGTLKSLRRPMLFQMDIAHNDPPLELQDSMRAAPTVPAVFLLSSSHHLGAAASSSEPT
eukprot:2760956-Prymnesium_polylepis.1